MEVLGRPRVAAVLHLEDIGRYGRYGEIWGDMGRYSAAAVLHLLRVRGRGRARVSVRLDLEGAHEPMAISPYLSLSLPTPPYTSLHLPTSPYISLDLEVAHEPVLDAHRGGGDGVAPHLLHPALHHPLRVRVGAQAEGEVEPARGEGAQLAEGEGVRVRVRSRG